VSATGNLTIRRAAPADSQALADIYNHYIATSTATFDTQQKSAEERREWLDTHGDVHPVFVAEVAGRIIGFGALSAWGTRCAYSRTVEVSTYVAPDSRGSGIGASLMESLIQAATDIGHHALIGQIVAGNEPSLRMSRRFGFEQVGCLREVGFKFNQALDVVLMERILPDTV